MKNFWSLLRATMLWIILLPYAVLYTGVASNQAVLFANHDTFPVMVNAAKFAEMTDDGKNARQLPDGTVMIDDVHCVMTNKTRLNLMADIFDLKDAIYSIGDFLILGGSAMSDITPFVWVALVWYKEKERLA